MRLHHRFRSDTHNVATRLELFYTARNTLEEVAIGSLNLSSTSHLSTLRAALLAAAPRLRVLEFRNITWSKEVDDFLLESGQDCIINLTEVLDVATRLSKLDTSIERCLDPPSFFDKLSNLQHFVDLRLRSSVLASSWPGYTLFPYSAFLNFLKHAPLLRRVVVP